MVFIVQCAIWRRVFKFVYVETVNESCYRMKKYSSQTRFRFLLKDVEVVLKLNI
jgi:hypothetical protein